MGCGSGVRGNSRHYPASCLPLRSEYFFGVEWLRDHVRTGGRYSGYLTMNPVVQNDGMGIDQNHTLKVLELAELLYNLQGVPGLDHCLDRMFSGEIQATMAELDFGMFLRRQGVAFMHFNLRHAVLKIILCGSNRAAIAP
jgi:hypothetical protein